MVRKLLLPLLVLLTPIPAEPFSTERGTAADAQALVARAIEAYKAEGTDALKRISAPSTDFRYRDLYVFVIGPDHKTVAHGGEANQVGVDVTGVLDPDGKAFGREFIEQANATGLMGGLQDARSGVRRNG